MTFSWLLLALGIVLLYGGAESLVRGSVSLSRRVGISPLVAGLTVVAFGTSMPELVVSLRAALAGSGGIAVGNVVGSNIANIALILGLAAVIRPIRVEQRLVRADVPLLVFVSLILAVLVWDERLGRVEAAALAGGLVAYVVVTLHWARREEATEAEPSTPPAASLVRDFVWCVAGLALLIGGAHVMVNGAVALARGFAVSEAVIGLTVVAVGTSLPELATSLLAAARGESDIALGNVVGSNLFNILGILGLSGLVRPLENTGIGGADLAVMAGLSVLLLPFLRTGFRLSRVEGAVFLALYAGYVVLLLA